MSIRVPLLGITAGDPCGIGPEVVLKALQRQPRLADQAVVFGSYPALRRCADKLGALSLNQINAVGQCKPGHVNILDPKPVELEALPAGQACGAGGDCAFWAARAAIGWALEGDIRAVATAPLSKEALRMAGHKYNGYPGIFGEYAGGGSHALMLWSAELKVIQVTDGLPLRQACDALSTGRIAEVIGLGDKALRKAGFLHPRVAVAGLNPHAGESGFSGEEELTVIAPAVEQARADGADVCGPLPPDTVFLKASRGEYDLVVAQHHDQGQVPFKLLAFDTGVDVTVGLKVTHTSVGHGTAFDIAGQMLAREENMLQAIELALQLSSTHAM